MICGVIEYVEARQDFIGEEDLKKTGSLFRRRGG